MLLQAALGTMIVACTSDGCCHIWNPHHKTALVTWRANASYQKDSIPQYAAVKNGTTRIVTARGNAIAYWDYQLQTLIAEWTTTQSTISAIAYHPGNANVVLVASADGLINGFDLRDPAKGSVLTVSVNDEVIKIAGNKAGADLAYAATASGRCFVWNSTDNSLNIVTSRKTPTAYFDSHFALPLHIYSPPNEPPVLTTSRGQTLAVAKAVEPKSIPLFHPIMPLVLFGSPGGAISVYDVVLF